MTQIERKELARHVGAHLTGRRIERRLTQEEVARKVGISRQALSLLERGNTLPALQTLYRISAAFHCEPWDLLPSRKQVS